MTFRSLAILLVPLLGLAAPAGQALAADPAAPAKEILKAAGHNSADSTDYQDYFSKDRLGRLYSKRFVKLYRSAWKKQQSDENSGYLLDHDPITNAQDGCPFKDLGIEAGKPADGKLLVEARFRALYCLGDTYKNEVTVVRFSLVEEKGKYVIDDIVHLKDGKVSDSLADLLKLLAKD